MRFIGNTIESKICDISNHDTKGGPHLPHHDQTTTNGRGSTLCSIDRDSGRFGANAQSKDKPSDEQMGPRIGHALPNTRQERHGRGNEDCATPTQVAVERLSEPATNYGAAQLLQTICESWTYF